MAVQFATAWSSVIKGVGAIAGGAYGCAEGSSSQALSTCMLGEPKLDLKPLFERTQAWVGSGDIEDTANIARQKIYLFSGYNDAIVSRPVVDTLLAFYLHYVDKPHEPNLFYQTAVGAGHSQVTLAFGGACAANGGEFINHCGYDQAGVILQQMYGALAPRNAGALGGQIVAFKQSEFTASDSTDDDSMGEQGFAYVPVSCAAMQPCRVHVALHGCLQSFSNIKEDFVRHAGYNEWADTNRIIVLYPQTKPSTFTRTFGSNPQACWDWWGYLDPNPTESPTYLLKSGSQIHAIKAMVGRLTSGAMAAPPHAAGVATAPATVRAIDATDAMIALAWSEVPGANQYEVLRAAPGQDFQPVGAVSGLSYVDAGLRAATSYRYQVRAVTQAKLGSLSVIVTGKTRAKTPRCDEPGRCPVVVR